MKTNRTIRDQVTDRIRNEVVAGKFPPGQPLREKEVAQRYGVSHGPVRDAFLQLTHEGFLVYQANRGVTVRQPPDPENRDFIVSLRQQIEVFVLQRGFEFLAEQANLDRISASLKNLKIACLAEDLSAVAHNDIAFHQAILTSCGGEDYLPIWKWLCSQMLMMYSRLEDYMQVYQEHADIFEALNNRKKKATISALKANIL
ncbi:MAG: GntR family transcriptional regulator [Gemmataceae bacterium]